MPQWDEEIYDNPDLMCEDPTDAADWEAFVASDPVKESDVEAFLSGAQSDLIPELYRELVPARATHADFFKRLVYHRNRLTQAMKNKVQELVMDDEEETGWGDDDEDIPPPVPVAAEAIQAAPESSAALEEARKETEALKAELKRVTAELTSSQEQVRNLERKLAGSEEARKELVAAAQDSEELPRKKAPEPLSANTFPTKPQEIIEHEVEEDVNPSVIEQDEAEEEEEEQQMEDAREIDEEFKDPVETESHEVERAETPASATSNLPPSSVATASWEALPTSANSSSSEEAVMLGKNDEDDLEEDDWE